MRNNGDAAFVFVDVETGGLDHARHPLTQVALVAVDRDLAEVEAMEVKVRFDAARAEPEALAINGHDPATWERDAVPLAEAMRRAAAFLRAHASVTVRHAGGERPVALLAGHNVAFDVGFLRAAERETGVRLPASRHALCTVSLALWESALGGAPAPRSYSLADLADHYLLEHRPSHEALADARASACLARAVLRRRRALEPGRPPLGEVRS